MISIKILIITGQNSYNTLKKILAPIKEHDIEVKKAPISISAFLTQENVRIILENTNLKGIELILIPGFVQWDAINLEKQYSVKIRKGPEFASDIPNILKKINIFELSTKISANKLLQSSTNEFYEEIYQKQLLLASRSTDSRTFYINPKTSKLMIGRNLPPPIIAEIVNCTEKSDKSILKKAKHYIDSGADIIDIGCVVNKPNPNRIKEIIQLLRNNFQTLLSIDTMNMNEIQAASEEKIDMILSLDFGNYNDLLNLPKDIPIVILPTNVKAGIFPKDPEERVSKLFQLAKELKEKGFKKLIADPLLETPISPGICKSLESYFLYKKYASLEQYRDLELPLFFGISNVVELMDVDSIGINGLLASIAVELDIGVLFTVEHSPKLMGGVYELKESVKLNYLSKYKNSPPINQGIQLFKAKGKIKQETPEIDESNAILVENLNSTYKPDENGYFKIYTNLYKMKIYVLFFSTSDELIQVIIGSNAETISKKIIELKLTKVFTHINYLGRELNKAEIYMLSGKPYIQDE